MAADAVAASMSVMSGKQWTTTTTTSPLAGLDRRMCWIKLVVVMCGRELKIKDNYR